MRNERNKRKNVDFHSNFEQKYAIIQYRNANPKLKQKDIIKYSVLCLGFTKAFNLDIRKVGWLIIADLKQVIFILIKMLEI